VNVTINFKENNTFKTQLMTYHLEFNLCVAKIDLMFFFCAATILLKTITNVLVLRHDK